MEQNDNITCKVVLVGDTGVGKTCIIQRYVNNQYTENNESTVASTYTYKVLDYPEFNKSISFDIWDTAGQELYRALAKNFYLNASIGILVYDIKRKASFESLLVSQEINVMRFKKKKSVKKKEKVSLKV